MYIADAVAEYIRCQSTLPVYQIVLKGILYDSVCARPHLNNRSLLTISYIFLIENLQQSGIFLCVSLYLVFITFLAQKKIN